MNTEFQILRWGIPGWIYLATFLIFKLAAANFQLEILAAPFGPNLTVIAGIAAFFAALGVPIGYILYQIYFCYKWTFGGKKSYLAAKNVPGLENVNTGNTREDWRTIERHLDSLMTVEVPRRNINYKDIKRRHDWYTNRTSRTHGLGSSVVAMVFGLFTFVALNNCTTVSVYNIALVFFVYILAMVATIINYIAMDEGTFLQINSIMLDINKAELLDKIGESKLNEGNEDDEEIDD